MAKEIKTNYRHKNGPVIITRGLSSGRWYAMIRTVTGGLQIFRPIKPSLKRIEVMQRLKDYEGKALGKAI